MGELCDKCGRAFHDGELRYQVKIETTSLFDGYIEEPDGDMDEEIERLIEVLSRQDPKQAEKDVAHSFRMVLCPVCRNRLIKEYEKKTPRVVH